MGHWEEVGWAEHGGNTEMRKVEQLAVQLAFFRFDSASTGTLTLPMHPTKSKNQVYRVAVQTYVCVMIYEWNTTISDMSLNGILNLIGNQGPLGPAYTEKISEK